jgi:hypothetical protein
MPIEAELISNRPPKALPFLDQYLAGEIGIMQLISTIEGIKMKWESKLVSWVLNRIPYRLPHRKLLFPLTALERR